MSDYAAQASDYKINPVTLAMSRTGREERETVKAKEIQIGHTYTDGKGRKRLVVDMGPQYVLYPGQLSTENLQYEIIHDGTKKNRKAGELHNMTVASFAAWSKTKVE